MVVRSITFLESVVGWASLSTQRRINGGGPFESVGQRPVDETLVPRLARSS